jgi:hypothetical protein
MAPTDGSDDRNRIARLALAGIAALLAVRSLRRGKRKTGLLAALGAVALGYTARADSEDAVAEADVDDAEVVVDDGATAEDAGTTVSVETTDGSGAKLRCAACGEPIVPGQRRGPDEHDRTVHEACLGATA